MSSDSLKRFIARVRQGGHTPGVAISPRGGSASSKQRAPPKHVAVKVVKKMQAAQQAAASKQPSGSAAKQPVHESMHDPAKQASPGGRGKQAIDTQAIGKQAMGGAASAASAAQEVVVPEGIIAPDIRKEFGIMFFEECLQQPGANFCFCVALGDFTSGPVDMGVLPADKYCTCEAGHAKAMAIKGRPHLAGLCGKAIDADANKMLMPNTSFLFEVPDGTAPDLPMVFVVAVRPPNMSDPYEVLLSDQERNKWLCNNYGEVFKHARAKCAMTVSCVPLGTGILGGSLKETVQAAVTAFKEFAEQMGPILQGNFCFFLVDDKKETAAEMARLSREMFTALPPASALGPSSGLGPSSQRVTFHPTDQEVSCQEHSPDSEYEYHFNPVDDDPTQSSSKKAAMLSFLRQGDGPAGERARGGSTGDGDGGKDCDAGQFSREGPSARLRPNPRRMRKYAHPKLHPGNATDHRNPEMWRDHTEGRSLEEPQSEPTGRTQPERSILKKPADAGPELG